MNRYGNIGFSCATVALIGLAVATLSAQQPATGRGGNPPAGQGRNIGSDTPGPASPAGPATTTLGTVRLSKAVKADGQPLAPGSYQVRVTDAVAAPPAPGQTPQYERFAEFLQGGQVKGREVVTIVTPDAAPQVLKDKFPPAGGYRADVLKGGDYYRVWFNKGGTHYLVHFNIG